MRIVPLQRQCFLQGKTMDFRVEVDAFRGPLDLLLFLVRKSEVDITDIPIAKVTEQYLSYLEILQELSINDVGDFLDLASTLIEIKSRMVLPSGGEEVEEWADERDELVLRLLEYKKFKDAASMLEERSRDWQQHKLRQAVDLPPRSINPAGQPIQELELWDLVSAMGRILKEHHPPQTATIVYDDTPIHVYMQRLHDRLAKNQAASFSEMFDPHMHKSALIGVFLAILELTRHHQVRAEQDDYHGEIWLQPGEGFDAQKQISTADDYVARKPVAEEMHVGGR